MSNDLTVSSTINSGLQQVQGQSGGSSALFVATNQVQSQGQDQVGFALPFWVQGTTSLNAYQQGTTWGRLIRVEDIGTSGAFYDIGIDQTGNLFINAEQSTETQHILTLSSAGNLQVNLLSINQLQLTGLNTPPSGVNTVDVVVDPQTGNLYRQS